MRCNGSPGKTRVNPHNGRSKGSYTHGMRGHAKEKNLETGVVTCSHCHKVLSVDAEIQAFAKNKDGKN